MPDTKISLLTAASALTGTEEIPLSDGTTTTKACTPAQILTYLQNNGMPRVWKLNTTHAISTIAGTEVTAWRVPGGGADVAITLEAGTFTFQYNLIIQAATATVSPLYGINFTGTAAQRNFGIRYWDAGPLTAGTGVADDTNASASVAQSPLSGQIHNAFTTTAPPMSHAGGVGTTNTNILVILEGLIAPTVAGDLELWHGSETATSTSIMAGSTLQIIRIA